MAASSFNNSPAVAVAYDPTAGVTLNLNGEVTTISPTSIICLLPGDTPGTYTLLNFTLSELIQTPICNPPAPLVAQYLFTALPAHLAPAAAETTVIVSTASGCGNAAIFHSDVLLPLFVLLDLTAAVVRTTSVTSIAEAITTLSARSKQQTILLLSGDTGIHDALNAIPAGKSTASTAHTSLAIFPLGTGNALASSLHTSRGCSPLAALLFGRPHALPTFTARFSPRAVWASTSALVPTEGLTGAVVVSWGFHASLVADADALRPTHGLSRFKISARDNLSPPHPYSGTLSILPPGADTAWRPIPREEHFYALATMCSNLEEAFRISPASHPGERVIRIVHFAPMPAEDVMVVMGGAYQGGTHVDDERVGYEVARGVRIEIGEKDCRWRRVCVDGGTVVVEENGWVEVLVDEEPEQGASVEVVWRD